jgi:hypothetical protein
MLYEAIWLRELDGNVFNLGLLAARSREEPVGLHCCNYMCKSW